MAVTQNLQAVASEDGSVEDQQQQPQGQVPPPPQQQHQHPSQPSHQHPISNASAATVDIEAWTVAALESLSIAPTAIGRGHSLSIPLDDTEAAAAQQQPQLKLRASVGFDHAAGNGITPPRGPALPSRRDSTKKREELRKGKEGSRHRRRWENDHLLHVPNVQPPLASDFQIHPTYPVLPTVPYQLAAYWDRGLRDAIEERKVAAHKAAVFNPAVPELGHVPRDLRATAKRTPAVKSWLKVLEEPVRQFVVERGLAVTAAAAAENDAEDSDETDPEDEEIVFVGRAGRATRDGKPLLDDDDEDKTPKAEWKKASVVRRKEDTETKGMVLDTVGDESGGAFKRWLTHSISDYYGLDSKSVVVGNPARKVIFVGVKQQHPHRSNPPKQQHTKKAPPPVCLPVLPPPLWEMF